MKIIHTLRNCPDWKNLNKHNFFEQKFDNQFVKGKLFELIKIWDQLLKPDYFEFRHQITEIALANHQKLQVDGRITETLGLLDKLKNVERPYLVIFCDDDDWHRPSVVPMLREKFSESPELDAIIWDHSVFLTNFKAFNWDKKEPYFLLDSRRFFHTNNYALTNNFFDKLTDEDVKYLHYGIQYEQCYGHNQIDRKYKPQMKIAQIHGSVFSTSSKTISSFSPWIEHGDKILKEFIPTIIQCQQYQPDPPEELNWAHGEIQATLEVYKSLAIKKQYA